ncbi:hypothetical protein ASG52_19780 [Methylobacterium sp. Leaf456]|uniref:hypothetical protein n=1 Tax=Methylobacterium sp. Leaf456 TaxID=1736382 RepID=UPI000701E0E8|nr:hypothetical protein [Methylobacterium sp. Leaf456]KQT59968.1 hypothetical protein ASG52_19780 [Methylobacterium sp. Leaf456]
MGSAAIAIVQGSIDLSPPVRTEVPDGLTDPVAVAILLRRGLEIVDREGQYDALPEAAKELFRAALFPPKFSAAKQVEDIAQERDDERALANRYAAIVGERDATIRALRAELTEARAS